METFTILEKVQDPRGTGRASLGVEKYRPLVTTRMVNGVEVTDEWCFTGQARIPYPTRLGQPKFEAGEATDYYFTFRNPDHPTRKLSGNDFVEWRTRLYKVTGYAFENADEYITLTVQKISDTVPYAT